MYRSGVLAVHGVQQFYALVQGQIFRQIFFQLRRVDIFDRIFTNKMGFIGQVIVERPNRRQLPGAGGRVKPIVRIPAVLVLNAVPAQIGHIAINIRQRYRGDQFQIDVLDVDLVQRQARQAGVPRLLQIAEEIPQVQKVFVHGLFGMGLDGFMICKKVPQDRWGLCSVITHCQYP